MRKNHIPMSEIIECASMADAGFSGKTIAGRHGLSVGQAYYRVRKSGRKISDYRNGLGWTARMVMKNIVQTEEAFAEQEKQVKIHLKELSKQKQRKLSNIIPVNKNNTKKHNRKKVHKVA